MPLLIWDNNGQTIDRYTILNKETGDIWGCSINPFHPQGFAQHCGNCIKDPSWNNYSITKRIQIYDDAEDIGNQVNYNDLPDDVKKYIDEIRKITTL